jgi:hypothetical protein
MTILYALLGAFQSLPAWTRWIFVALSLAITLGFGAFLDTTAAIIVIVGLLVVGLVIAGFWLLIKRRREKKAAAFGGDLQQQSATTPGGIADPARRARLEDLRRNFEKGIETFRAAGKNLYEVPWYVIVGEPGAGKTEAIRHSNVGFPPGMQDEFQGVGGTINMNWWFTNDAVILDTAGRLLFEEVEPGTTGEWRVFLEMLKKNRPNCPINGLVLAIPAESLIKDTPDQIQKKAGKIAQQMEVIQRQLDVRFPAYVVITKCDLLNGFREFFDDLIDPQAQQQMMGWSNPDPLDAPFRPDLVDAHIYTVVERMRRRRQGLLLDPVARAAERRADEVDRLFSLPHSISLIAANLRHYLETVFVAGAWSVRPLFLRGIYFTSSLREGSALDQELADALGVDVDALPEGKAWERERAYFLRDLFLEKSFRERGLVTRATNTSQLVLKRRLTLLGTACAGLLLLLGLSWLGYRSLRSSIGTQTGYWARASEEWADEKWKPIVTREGATKFDYEGDEPVGPGITERTRLLFKNPDVRLDEFHHRLGEFASKPLDVSVVFRPIARFGVEIDGDRRRAQRVVFDGGIVRPLVENSRAKMLSTVPDPNASTDAAQAREGDALLALVRLEANIVKRRERRSTVAFNGTKILPPLFGYTSGDGFDAALSREMDAIYVEGKEGAELWPPDWLSGGLTLANNTAIDAGLNRFINDARRATQTRIDGLPLIIKAIEELRTWQRLEESLFVAANAKRAPSLIDKDVFEATDRLIAQKTRLDQALAQAKKAGLFDNTPVLLATAYERLFGELRARYERALAIDNEITELTSSTRLQAIKQTVETVAAGKGDAIDSLIPDKKEYVLFREIREKLKPVLADLQEKFKGTLSDADLAEVRLLDETHLADPQKGALRYEIRWDLYNASLKAAPDPRTAPPADLIGQQWKPLTDAKVKIPQIRTEVDAYNGVLQDRVQVICRYCLARAERELGRYYSSAYIAQTKQRVGAVLRFPLAAAVNDFAPPLKPDELVPAVKLIERVAEDLASPVVETVDGESKQSLVKLRQNLKLLDPIISGLLTPDKQLRTVTIVLLGRADQLRLSPQASAMDAFKQTELRVGAIDHATPVRGGPQRVPSDSPTSVVLGKFELFTQFHFHFYRNPGEARPLEVPAPADWTALRILDQQRATRLADGRRWQFPIQPAQGKVLWYEFQFDAPLPEFEDWPRKTLLDIDAPPVRR